MSKILDYEIYRKISENKNSITYKVVDNINRLFVIKVLKRETTSKQDREMFTKEFNIGQKLKNQQIINYYSVEQFENRPALIIEYFEANTLEQFSSKNNFDIEIFLDIMIKITNSIKYIHKNRVIHRNINPNNILIDENYNIKIYDFSLSEYIDNISDLDTNVFIDYLNYISPEQTGRINEKVDITSDLYSLGATFYKLITNEKPFDDKEPNEIIYSHIAKIINSPSYINEDIPEQISLIIMKLLDKKKSNRYQSAESLKNDLEICLKQYKENKIIELFNLGDLDNKYKFIIPDKLYGRDNELNTLLDNYSQTKLFLISGVSGSGKSSLVNKFHKEIKGDITFISGKFEQLRNNTPYQILAESFSSILNSYLFNEEEYINNFKNELKDKLGENLYILSSIIPEISLIFPEIINNTDLVLIREQNRFKRALLDFIEIFSEKKLIIFLDDIQWADIPTLELLPYV
ncbi:MAG: protein kinase, partial [Candidatus Sericytochromatia bacterium]